MLLTIIQIRDVWFLHRTIADKALNPIPGIIENETKQSPGNEDQFHIRGWGIGVANELNDLYILPSFQVSMLIMC